MRVPRARGAIPSSIFGFAGARPTIKAFPRARKQALSGTEWKVEKASLHTFKGGSNRRVRNVLGGDNGGRFDKLGSWRNPVLVALNGRSLRVQQQLSIDTKY